MGTHLVTATALNHLLADLSYRLYPLRFRSSGRPLTCRRENGFIGIVNIRSIYIANRVQRKTVAELVHIDMKVPEMKNKNTLKLILMGGTNILMGGITYLSMKSYTFKAAPCIAARA